MKTEYIGDYDGSLLSCGHSSVFRALAVQMQEAIDLASFPGSLLKRREPRNEATSDPGFNSVQSILSGFWFFTYSPHTIGPL